MKELKKTLLIGLILLVFYYVFTFYYVFKIASLLIEACLPIVIGFFLAFLLEPMIARVIRLKIDRVVACGYVYFITFLILFIGLRYLIPPIIEQIVSFIDQLPTLQQRIRNIIGEQYSFLFEMIDFDIFVKGLLNEISNIGMRAFEKMVDQLVILSLAVGASIYISIDYLSIKKNIVKLYPQKHFIKTWYVSKKLAIVTFEYIKGLLWDSLFLYIMSLILLFLIDFEYPYVYALFVTITNLIPYIGPYIGGALVGIVGFSTSIDLGIKSLVIVMICQYVESTFVQPLILQNKTDLHPVINVLGVSFFGSLFGIMGMVMSRLILLYLKILYEDFLKGRIEQLTLENTQKIRYNLREIKDKEE